MRPDLFDPIVTCLTGGVPVSLSRWGDGEWHALLGHHGQNCDGQLYTAPLRAALTEVLDARPRYHLGLQPLAEAVLGVELRAWLERRGLAPTWCNAELFVQRSITGTLDPFVTALAYRRVLLVGPWYLERLRLFPFVRQVVVPDRAFPVWRVLLASIRQAIAATRADVVLLSAGMSSNLIVHALAESHPDVTALDCGALWEPYVGKATRTYHKAVLARERVRA